MLADLPIEVNEAVCKQKDDSIREVEDIEKWVNRKLEQTTMEAKKMNYKCEICESREGLELHHIAGRKHDYRTITVCNKCHRELSNKQKVWGDQWLQTDQPEAIKNAFFMRGLQDVLILKGKGSKTNCERIADNLTEAIFKRLSK